MKQLVNSILSWLLTAIGLSLAAVSAYLTAIFLYNYGSGSGYGFAYSAAGVLLDVLKTFFPIAALMAIRNGYKAIGLLCLASCSVMMFTSYNISVSALADSADKISRESARHSAVYVNASDSIETLQAQIDVKTERVKRLRDANLHTKADQFQNEIDAHYGEIRQLVAQRGDKPDTSNNEFNLTAAKILSALIEINSGLALLAVSAIGRPLEQEDKGALTTESIVPAAAPPEPVAEPFDDPLKDVDSIELPIAEDYQEPRPAQEVCDEIIEEITEYVPPVESSPKAEQEPPLLAQAKQLLTGGHARPSQRSLADAMGIKRPDAEQILTELEEVGFLVRDGRTRALA